MISAARLVKRLVLSRAARQLRRLTVLRRLTQLAQLWWMKFFTTPLRNETRHQPQGSGRNGANRQGPGLAAFGRATDSLGARFHTGSRRPRNAQERIRRFQVERPFEANKLKKS